MNFIKAQQELLKVWGYTESLFKFGDYDENKVAYTMDGVSVIIIPRNLFLLDYKKAGNIPSDFFKNRKLHPDQNSLVKWTKTGVSKEIKDKLGRVKGYAVELTNANGSFKYIQEKLIKQFEDKKNPAEFYGLDDLYSEIHIIDPVWGVIGMICPINMTQGGALK